MMFQLIPLMPPSIREDCAPIMFARLDLNQKSCSGMGSVGDQSKGLSTTPALWKCKPVIARVMLMHDFGDSGNDCLIELKIDGRELV
jgi:hypothetical protein